MKINIRDTVKDYKGEDMMTAEKEGGKERKMTTRDALNAVVNGVEVTQQGQQALISAEDKAKIFQLSSKLWNVSKEIDLSVEELAFIKDRAWKVANITPLVYGRVVDLLENKHGKQEIENKEN